MKIVGDPETQTAIASLLFLQSFCLWCQQDKGHSTAMATPSSYSSFSA